MEAKSIDQILEEFDEGDYNKAHYWSAFHMEGWLRSAIASAILHAAEECKQTRTREDVNNPSPIQQTLLMQGYAEGVSDFQTALRAYAEKLSNAKE